MVTVKLAGVVFIFQQHKLSIEGAESDIYERVAMR